MLQALRQQTLFSRILFTIATVSILFQLFTLAILGLLTLIPLGKQSAKDLAVLMHNAAVQSVDLTAEGRGAFAQSLWRINELKLGDPSMPLDEAGMLLPYLYFLESALQELDTGSSNIMVSTDAKKEEWYWVDFSVSGNTTRVGFPRKRIGVQPPFAFFIVLSVGTLVLLLTSVLLARRITRPLEELSDAASHIGKGEWPEPLLLHGPIELTSLAESFNHMSRQLRRLIANRTTMLAGISHDLRTPLARIQLAVAMLPDDVDVELQQGIERDINDMNTLIGQFLDVSRGLDEQQLEIVDVSQAFSELVERARDGGATIELQPGGECELLINRMALCRIISNLLENAQRYGHGSLITISYRCQDKQLMVSIADRGPGIPPEYQEAVFEPFFRLEKSRSSQTGGSGLGLAIAKQLADSNGWLIFLEPRSGGGTVAKLLIKYPE